jgi:hypothetical protein
LVALFALSTLRLVGDPASFVGGAVIVGFLIWDPFKWFVVKS